MRDPMPQPRVLDIAAIDNSHWVTQLSQVRARAHRRVLLASVGSGALGVAIGWSLQWL